jgi:hypothetical protein
LAPVGAQRAACAIVCQVSRDTGGPDWNWRTLRRRCMMSASVAAWEEALAGVGLSSIVIFFSLARLLRPD